MQAIAPQKELAWRLLGILIQREQQQILQLTNLRLSKKAMPSS